MRLPQKRIYHNPQGLVKRVVLRAIAVESDCPVSITDAP